MSASELISKTAQGIHSITWVLRIAKFTPEVFEERLVVEHDHRMRTLYSEIVAAEITLAARDKKLYTNTIEIVDTLHQFDGKLSGISPDLYVSGKRQQTLQDMGRMWQEVHHYLRDIPSIFPEV